MLKFIGCGSAFNTELGNNSAYIKNGNKLLLIDCGSNTFDSIMSMNLLDGIDDIIVLITHTHPDHIGSLGDLIFYSYYSMGNVGEPCLTVLSPKGTPVGTLLHLMGVNKKLYINFKFENLIFTDLNGTMMINTVKVNHVPELKCFGYEIYFGDKIIYYSGDCNDIPKDVLRKLHNGTYDQFYQDTCMADYDGNVHLSLRKLDELIKQDVRHKVYCMHSDKSFDYGYAEGLGFKVVLLEDELWD